MTDPEAAPPRSHRSRRRAQGDWLLAEIVLGTVLFFCPLAIATVHPWAVAVAAALSLLAVTLAAWATLRSGEPFLVPAPGLAFAIVAAFIGLQLVPLPPWLVGLLAPHTRELFDFVLAPLGRYPAWRALSLDPPATARELAKAVTYLSVFLAAAQVVRSRRAKTRVVTMLGVAGLIVALIGFGHALWGSSTLFGFFNYKHAAPPLLTTFGNRNHLASFLSLGATALLARVLTERDRKIATLWGFAYLATGVGVLVSLSRGGTISFIGVQLMLAIAVWMVRQSEREGVALKPRAFAVPAGVLLVLAVSAYIAWDALADRVASLDTLEKIEGTKLGMWPTFWPLVREHWLVGVGRGAFEPAYQRFQDVTWGVTTFTHAENIVGQWCADLGVPVGLFLMGACLWALLGALKRGASDPERLACIFGLLAIALHELVDFGLELGGLAVPATVAFAVATFRQEKAPSFRRRTAVMLVPVVAGVTALCLWQARHSLDEDAQSLGAMLGKEKADAVEEAASAMSDRHPADYYSHLVAAQAFAAERPLHADKLVGFANRAMYLNPALPAPHRLAALALRATGHLTQARIEYKLAYELKDSSVLPEVTRVFKKPEELVEAMPDTPEALCALADQLIAEHRLDDADAVTRTSIERHGEKAVALQRLASIAARRGLPDEEFKVGVRLSEVAPSETTGLQVRVEALLTLNDPVGALALLEGEGLKRFPTDAGVLLSLARLRLQRGDTKGVREAIKRLPASMDANVRLAAISLEAAAAEHDGQGTKALSLMRQAVTMRPEDAGWRWQYAALLERLGRDDQAVREAEAAVLKAPGLREQVEQLKERAAARKKQMEEMHRWKEVGAEDKAP